MDLPFTDCSIGRWVSLRYTFGYFESAHSGSGLGEWRAVIGLGAGEMVEDDAHARETLQHGLQQRQACDPHLHADRQSLVAGVVARPGNAASSAKNVSCSACVEPDVKMRMPGETLRPIQCFIVATASGATTSIENTPVKRSGCAATASAT